MIKQFLQYGIHLPTLLLPCGEVDLHKWSVVACDQYTSQREYWEEADRLVGSSPSTLRLVLPEVYLEEPDCENRIRGINQTMLEYLRSGVLCEEAPGFILVDRKTSHTASRKGLVIGVDLDRYEYTKGSQSLIRATEATVEERLPPRIRIRQEAAVECPHILMLVDDPGKTLIEPLAAYAAQQKPAYDFDLMMGGGHIKGYKINDPSLLQGMLKALEALSDIHAFRSRYGAAESNGLLLFAVGDGNHSLAAAKAHWENIKKDLSPEQAAIHPARFALVELMNVHDEGLTFEPIHRVVFQTNPVKLLEGLCRLSGTARITSHASCAEALAEAEAQKAAGKHAIPFVSAKGHGVFIEEKPAHNLEVGTLQQLLDRYAREQGSLKIDYVHGEEVVGSLGCQEGNIGFYLPALNKYELFRTVILNGVLPRKTFSMGEAEEKRFYLECRKIK